MSFYPLLQHVNTATLARMDRDIGQTVTSIFQRLPVLHKQVIERTPMIVNFVSDLRSNSGLSAAVHTTVRKNDAGITIVYRIQNHQRQPRPLRLANQAIITCHKTDRST